MKIFLSGSSGVIGTIIRTEFPGYHFLTFDLPGHDARNYHDVLTAIAGCDAAIHLAWDTKGENWKTGNINPDNALMTYNVYTAALASGVKRVIMASSVHANDYNAWQGLGLMDPYTLPTPDSPYGASKVFMEALGRYFSRKGLEVVCIRFMGVNADNKPSADDPEGRNKWFSHRDCAELIRAILEAPLIPNNFVIVHGVSNNAGRLHDISNPFGWIPKDGT
jgi:nucleoside-diphosphate-sugar epimerase